MRVLLITLIVGTLFFGVIFPEFVVVSGFLALMFMFTGMFLSLSGAFDGKHVIIRENDKHTADNPEVIVTRSHVEESDRRRIFITPLIVIETRNPAEESDVSDFAQDSKYEIIELPTDTLSTENKEEKQKEKLHRG